MNLFHNINGACTICQIERVRCIELTTQPQTICKSINYSFTIGTDGINSYQIT